MYSASPVSLSASKPAGVPWSGKNLRVARFTDLSVACADRMTAISSWNVLLYSSSVVGLGLAACRRWNISVRLAMFMCFDAARERSEEHTSELQSLMRISYAGVCLKKKNKTDKS